MACRSEPARSTRLSLPTRIEASPSGPVVLRSTMMVKMECERDDVSFIAVALVWRAFLPTSM